MKICINSEVFATNNLTKDEVLFLLSLANKCSFENAEKSLISKGFITRGGIPNGPYIITDNGSNALESVLLQSDTSIPTIDICRELADKLIQIFPRGIKPNSNSPWRGNERDIALRMQKFFKIYGSKWTNDEIIEATKRYVEHYSSDRTCMRTLKYFIMKSEKKINGEGVSYVEDVSDLATWLENKEETSSSFDWLNEMR